MATVENITSKADFDAWLADHELIAYYILAKPVETPLTDEELDAYAALHTNRPNMTVMNDSGTYMDMKYLQDIDDETTSYLLKKIQELKSLIDSMKE